MRPVLNERVRDDAAFSSALRFFPRAACMSRGEILKDSPHSTRPKEIKNMPEQPEAAARADAELKLDAASATATYSNLCRVTGTPEEVIMEFALNPNLFGQPPVEAIKVDHRIVMGYQAAKRTALILMETI